MADIKSPIERSRNMAAIHGKNTKPEVYLRKLLFAHGYRYRKNYEKIPGRPDIYLPKYRTAIFVHGCFWHRHEGCKYAYVPKSNVEFWKKKFQDNIDRDNIVREELFEMNIKCFVVWECRIRRINPSNIEGLLEEIYDFLNSDTMYKER